MAPGGACERDGVVRPGFVLWGTVIAWACPPGCGCRFAFDGFSLGSGKESHRLQLLLGHDAAGMVRSGVEDHDGGNAGRFDELRGAANGIEIHKARQGWLRVG